MRHRRRQSYGSENAIRYIRYSNSLGGQADEENQKTRSGLRCDRAAACAAAYLNWSYVDTPEDLLAAQQTDAQADTQTDASADSTAGEGDYFASSRLTRTQARDEAVSTLKELSESDTADQSAKDDAAAQISALADDTVAEANIESLIRAKGYEDAVVMLGDGSANIVVAPPDGGLQAEDVAVIRDIVISETGMTAGQIKIVEAS